MQEARSVLRAATPAAPANLLERVKTAAPAAPHNWSLRFCLHIAPKDFIVASCGRQVQVQKLGADTCGVRHAGGARQGCYAKGARPLSEAPSTTVILPQLNVLTFFLQMSQLEVLRDGRVMQRPQCQFTAALA
jgi:hypothetical protein